MCEFVFAVGEDGLNVRRATILSGGARWPRDDFAIPRNRLCTAVAIAEPYVRTQRIHIVDSLDTDCLGNLCVLGGLLSFTTDVPLNTHCLCRFAQYETTGLNS